MLTIRLRRVGKTKRPAYRFVVADSRAPRDGDFLETVGTYNPLTDPPSISVDEGKVREWLAKGAQPSETAEKLLKRVGVTRGAATETPAIAEA